MATLEHDDALRQFSEYYDGTLPAATRADVEAHLASCERCQAEYARFREAVGALAGLGKTRAPRRLPDEVAQTIHRRSAGRFFGRRAFGDRVPFELLAVVGLVLVLGAYLLLHFSATGTVHDPLDRQAPPADAAPGARDVLPRP